MNEGRRGSEGALLLSATDGEDLVGDFLRGRQLGNRRAHGGDDLGHDAVDGRKSSDWRHQRLDEACDRLEEAGNEQAAAAGRGRTRARRRS